jgi:hypothetical protein
MPYVELTPSSVERLEKWEAKVEGWHPKFCDFAGAYLEGCECCQGLTTGELMHRLRAQYQDAGMKGFDFPDEETAAVIAERVLWLRQLRASRAGCVLRR